VDDASTMQLHSIPRLDLTRLLSFNGGTVGNTAAFAGGCRQDSGECSKLLDLNCDSAISGMMKQPIHALFTCLLDTSDLDEQSLWGDAVSAFSLTAAHMPVTAGRAHFDPFWWGYGRACVCSSATDTAYAATSCSNVMQQHR